MANVKVCDICGEKCYDSGRYELTYHSFLTFKKKKDICFSCMSKIKTSVLNKNIETLNDKNEELAKKLTQESY